MARTTFVNITKAAQCRHSEHQGFVTYQFVGVLITATCSNCGSVSAAKTTQEFARNDLMKIEAPPLVP